MKNKILVIDGDEATALWLKNLLILNGYEVDAAMSGELGLSKFLDTKPDLIILDSRLPDMDGELVIKSISQESGDTIIPVIVFSSSHLSEDISHLFELGISDYVQKRPGVEDELLGKCSTSLIRVKSSTGPLHSGKLISFFSAKGGNGTSTLCLNLTHSLAKQVEPKSVLVVDLVLPLGSLAIMTGVKHGNSIARLSTESIPQDVNKLKEYLLPVERWNFSILPGSWSPDDGQKLDPSRILPIVKSLLHEYDYVVVDLGKTLSRISLPILEISDVVVIILGPDLVTAELSHIALHFLQDIGVSREKLFLVLNRAVGLEGLSKAEIEQRISYPIQRTIPHVRDNFTVATNQKLPYSVQFPGDNFTLELDGVAKLFLKMMSTS